MITSSIHEPTRSRTAREANKPQVSVTRRPCCFRLILTTLIVWAGLAIMPRLSSAGSITYTWQNEDGPPASGDLVVSGDAQANGQIQFADVIDFNFMVKLTTSTGSEEVVFTTGDLLDSGFPVPISTVTAGPTPQFLSLTASNSKGILEVEFDQDWNLIVGQGLALMGSNGFNAGSEGQWIITGASIPEPSTLTLSGLACFFGMAYIRRAAPGILKGDGASRRQPSRIRNPDQHCAENPCPSPPTALPLQGSQLDRSTLRQEFEQPHQAWPWSGLAHVGPTTPTHSLTLPNWSAQLPSGLFRILRRAPVPYRRLYVLAHTRSGGGVAEKRW